MLQILGVKGEAVVTYREPLTMRLRRTGAGDAASSAFPKGKQHGDFFLSLDIIISEILHLQLNR